MTCHCSLQLIGWFAFGEKWFECQLILPEEVPPDKSRSDFERTSAQAILYQMECITCRFCQRMEAGRRLSSSDQSRRNLPLAKSTQPTFKSFLTIFLQFHWKPPLKDCQTSRLLLSQGWNNLHSRSPGSNDCDSLPLSHKVAPPLTRVEGAAWKILQSRDIR